MIQKETLKFLREIKKNNNKIWFDENKSRYINAKENIQELFEFLMTDLNKTDKIEQYKIYQIYRDLRFSKDKTPYKTHLSGFLSRQGAERRGSYWLQLKANGNCLIGGGFYKPEKEDLYRIRKEFEADASDLEKILANKKFQEIFHSLQGESVKTAPKGFDKTHPNIKHIRMKSFYTMTEFPAKEVCKENFPQKITESFILLRPFFDLMSEILTTNLNGEKVIS